MLVACCQGDMLTAACLGLDAAQGTATTMQAVSSAQSGAKPCCFQLIHLSAVMHCSNLTFWRSLYLPGLPRWVLHLQVWPGALLLADYLLDQTSYDGCTAVELGAGPGLAGIALARQAAQVLLTGEMRLLQLPAATLQTPVQTLARMRLLLKLAAPFRHTCACLMPNDSALATALLRFIVAASLTRTCVQT